MNINLFEIEQAPEKYLPALQKGNIYDVFKGVFYDEVTSQGKPIEESEYYSSLSQAIGLNKILNETLGKEIFRWVLRYMSTELSNFPNTHPRFNPDYLESELKLNLDKVPFSKVIAIADLLLDLDHLGFEVRQVLTYETNEKGYEVQQEIYVRTEDGLFNLERLKSEISIKLTSMTFYILEGIKRDLSRKPFQYWCDLVSVNENDVEELRDSINRMLESDY